MTSSALGPVLVPPQLVSGAAAPAGVADLAKRGQIREAAEKFEATFLSVMLQPMFEAIEPAAPFGGGPGESMFKSFLTEAMGKQMARSGGVGIADQVQREMLKMQGLS